MEVSLHSAEEEANKMRKENETLTSKSKQDIQQVCMWKWPIQYQEKLSAMSLILYELQFLTRKTIKYREKPSLGFTTGNMCEGYNNQLIRVLHFVE